MAEFEIRYLQNPEDESNKNSGNLLILNSGLSNKREKQLHTELDSPHTATFSDALKTFSAWRHQEVKPKYQNICMYIDTDNNMIAMRQITSLVLTLSLLPEKPIITLYHPEEMSAEKIQEISKNIAFNQQPSESHQVDVRFSPIPETKITN